MLAVIAMQAYARNRLNSSTSHQSVDRLIKDFVTHEMTAGCHDVRVEGDRAMIGKERSKSRYVVLQQSSYCIVSLATHATLGGPAGSQ
jgi:hypothetical protein